MSEKRKAREDDQEDEFVTKVNAIDTAYVEAERRLHPQKITWARRQIAVPKNLQKAESQGEYNIWYHKYTGDFGDSYRDKETPALTRCDPNRDSGWTKADLQAHRGQATAYFCRFFARGACHQGRQWSRHSYL